jgi:pimeloyl-ACP methyl ester carboxylesterase
MTDLQTFEHKGVILTFRIIGNGSSSILAFHGFGQNASAFDSWEKVLGQTYTIYSFNLIFHGSLWPYGEKPFGMDLLEEIFDEFLKTKALSRFSLAAFSIGAKFALVLAQKFSGRIDKLILLAPDGIKPDFWYQLATGTSAFRWIFKHLITDPGIFLWLVNFVDKFRFIPLSTTRFVRVQMSTKEKREKVYYVWVVLRMLKINPRRLANILNNDKVNTRIFIGDEDKIITRDHVNKLLKWLNNKELVILKVSHHHLICGCADWIRFRAGSL